MIPHMKSLDINLFYKYLNNASNYLEYGSGGSTYQAAIRKNIVQIISVESDLEWHNNLQSIIKTNNTDINSSRILFKYIDMKTLPNHWGHPGPGSTINDWKQYSNVICELDKSISQNIDFILIDGRFRVACCLKCFDIINDACYIAMDDFIIRKEYYIVLDYYDIVEQTDDKCMVILKKKNVEKPSDEIISRYEAIED